MSHAELDQTAKSILTENDQGGYTIPTKGLYPYQWNWDSVFVALGFAEFDRDRAWREIEMLFEGQWRDGMVPHILFRKDFPVLRSGEPTADRSQVPAIHSLLWQLLLSGILSMPKKTLFQEPGRLSGRPHCCPV
ncbi:hypothetical protein [Roseibium sp.]|uniref:MGH1-like glycoside hydrolase domain-containing protein n=1 Tax=Roseibium sp. TaxID=1936156 RepID=UPI00261DBA74|nr:hypothetical protein [Roseibium sp.]